MKRKRANQAAAPAINAKTAALDSDRQMASHSDEIQMIQIASVTTMAVAAAGQGQKGLQGQGHHEGKRALEARIMEISPFERTPTFKCVFCPKRSQNRERMERHVAQEHPGRMGEEQQQQPGYRQMSRDQGC